MQIRKIVVLFMSLAIIAMMIVSCTQKDRISLKLNLKQGESYNIRVTIDQKISQTIQEQLQEISQTIGIGYVFYVEDVASDKVMTVKITFNFMQLKMSGSGMNLNYDSSNSSGYVDPAAQGFAALLNQSFSMRITSDGLVKNVEGIDELLKRVIDSIDIADNTVKASIVKSIRDQFGEKAMKETMAKMMAIYPDKPVGIGDSWGKETVNTTGFPLKIKNKYKFKSSQNGNAIIDIKGDIKSSKSSGIDMGGVTLYYDISGKQSGEMSISETTGWMICSKITQELSGEVEMNTQGQRMSWPISINTIITTDNISLSENQTEEVKKDKVKKEKDYNEYLEIKSILKAVEATTDSSIIISGLSLTNDDIIIKFVIEGKSSKSKIMSEIVNLKHKLSEYLLKDVDHKYIQLGKFPDLIFESEDSQFWSFEFHIDSKKVNLNSEKIIPSNYALDEIYSENKRDDRTYAEVICELLGNVERMLKKAKINYRANDINQYFDESKDYKDGISTFTITANFNCDYKKLNALLNYISESSTIINISMIKIERERYHYLYETNSKLKVELRLEFIKFLGKRNGLSEIVEDKLLEKKNDLKRDIFNFSKTAETKDENEKQFTNEQ